MSEQKRFFKYTYLSAVFLAVLILIAPCKVRNSIESALGVKQSNVVNKFKVRKQSCCGFKTRIVKNEQQQQIGDYQKIFEPADFSGFDAFLNFGVEKAVTGYNELSLGAASPVVPLYILYRNFKVYPS